MIVKREELKALMKNKLMQAGLSGEHAEMTAEVLVWSDERGYHSHGSVRMEYYCERIAKGGINTSPNFSLPHHRPLHRHLRGRQRLRLCRGHARNGARH